MWPRDAYVGQRVVCIDASPSDPTYTIDDLDGLTVGIVYTVRRIGIDEYWGSLCFWLNEIDRGVEPEFERFGETGYSVRRFKPVDESRLDIFREMLNDCENLERQDA